MKIKKNNILKSLNENGYFIIKNFFNSHEKKKLLDFTDSFSKSLIEQWIVQNEYKLNIKKKNIRKKIIYYYDFFNKPEYRRNPQKNCANKQFFELINIKKFINFHKIIESNNWYFSFIKNLRFKSTSLPWTTSKWHCDRFTFRDYNNSNMKFLIFWIPLQNINKKTGSGIKLVSKKTFSFHDLSNSLKKNIRDKNFFLLNKNKYSKKFKNNTIEPSLKFGDLLIFDSNIIHKTGSVISKKPIWNMDIRFEYGKKINYETILGGFNMRLKSKTKYNKLIKSANLNII